MVSWATVKRTSDKALAVIADARERLELTGVVDGDLTYDTFDAIELLNAAAKRVGSARDTDRKSLGISTYTPYGRKGLHRRW